MNKPCIQIHVPRQRGAVLFIALIVLVAMTLASIALIRSVDTATIGAGNIAFKQSAVQASERAVATALAQFDATTTPPGFLAFVANGTVDQVALNYRASMQATDPNGNGIPTILTDTSNFDAVYPPGNRVSTATNETVRYVIERLCTESGQTKELTCIATNLAPAGGSQPPSNTPGSVTPLFRVTVRADGPRNTVNYTQVIFKP
jgi:Tfp pilus assembly protein PilX